MDPSDEIAAHKGTRRAQIEDDHSNNSSDSFDSMPLSNWKQYNKKIQNRTLFYEPSNSVLCIKK